jgi:hypothetical protein
MTNIDVTDNRKSLGGVVTTIPSMPDAGQDSSHQPPCDALRTSSAETATSLRRCARA